MFLLFIFFMSLNSTVATSALVGQNVACMTDFFFLNKHENVIERCSLY